MTIRNTYAAESWDKVYTAFQQINFTSYDYDTIKESLLQYLKIYHAEHFNDFIESSELIAILELFAYVAELMAYRVDTAAHENFISTAQRKQSILRLAKLVSYRAARNIPARGLVKINTVRTSEAVYDSLGNNLAGISVNWNDSNNSNWKEQFFLVMNKSLTSKFGNPSKSYQIGDVLMQTYTFNNSASAFVNGVAPFAAVGTNEQIQMEVVPVDIDENGPYERSPDANAQFNIVYAFDGKGDGSDYTGFLMFVKQGSLLKTDYEITEPTSNRRIELDAINVNDTDVWVYRVNDSASITENWKRVETLSEQNLYFNDVTDTRKKYEVETLENDKIALLFGDNNFSDAPIGKFQIWTRVSTNADLNIPKNRIVNQRFAFTYVNQTNNTHDFNLTFSLTSALQNNAPSETIEHIRQSAPSAYYAQNRMVNGQDYNTYPLKDQTILRLKTINRTFAGQPKFIEWNDSSRKYENIKLFGDDMSMFLDVSSESVETRSSSKTITDSFIEPLLQTNALLTTLTHVMATSPQSDGIISYPRRRFIEDNRQIYFDIDGNPVNPFGKNLDGSDVQVGNGSLKEKSVIQAALDRHWYGDPLSFKTINGVRHGVIPGPSNPEDDGNLYVADLPRTIDGVNTYPPGDAGSGLQQIARQAQFGLRYNRFLKAFGDGDIELYSIGSTAAAGYGPTAANPLVDSIKKEVITIEMTSDSTTFTVISNVRGKLPDYSLSNGGRWSNQTDVDLPIDFNIINGATDFAVGDAFVIDIEFVLDANSQPTTSANAVVRSFGILAAHKINLNGWWELLPEFVISGAVSDGGAGISADGPTLIQQMSFDNADVDSIIAPGATTKNPNSWLFLVASKNGPTGEIESFIITNRTMKVVVESLTTKFWYYQDTPIIDPETKKPVFDKIRILRSNLDEQNKPLKQADIYDVVGFVYDRDGIVNFNQLEVLPTDTINFTQAGNSTPDNLLQFENFSKDSYQYGVYENGEVRWFGCGPSGPEYQIIAGYDMPNYDSLTYDFYGIVYSGFEYSFATGNMVGRLETNDPADLDFAPVVVRRRMVVAPVSNDPGNNNIAGCNIVEGLDFMWQHFSPVTHLVDPSATNIHDSFIMTRGYYSNVMDYVNGLTSINPAPPTPLELRTSYGYLLKNKMVSDTVVLHPGKIKLLFGPLADQTVRAKFKVVKPSTATFSDERIKAEIINVINTFFDIQNWDFGDKFYATELISMIHQRLATQISSVVIVPTYSINSFGSLFTIDSGFDEILQSAATLNDIEIVPAFTPSVLRQIR